MECNPLHAAQGGDHSLFSGTKGQHAICMLISTYIAHECWSSQAAEEKSTGSGCQQKRLVQARHQVTEGSEA